MALVQQPPMEELGRGEIARMMSLSDPWTSPEEDTFLLDFAYVNRRLRALDEGMAGDLSLDVRLMTGREVATGVPCLRTDLVATLKLVIKAKCNECTPFKLVHQGRVLRSSEPLGALPEGAELCLIRCSVADLSEALVGRNGAAARGDLAEISTLLLDGADVNWRDGSRLRTPLMWAASAGKTSAAKVLLSRGADPRLRAIGTNAATVARSNGHEELARYLDDAAQERRAADELA